MPKDKIITACLKCALQFLGLMRRWTGKGMSCYKLTSGSLNVLFSVSLYIGKLTVVFVSPLTVVQKSGLQLLCIPKQWYGPFCRSAWSCFKASGSSLHILIAQQAALVRCCLIFPVKLPLSLYVGFCCTSFSRLALYHLHAWLAHSTFCIVLPQPGTSAISVGKHCCHHPSGRCKEGWNLYLYVHRSKNDDRHTNCC